MKKLDLVCAEEVKKLYRTDAPGFYIAEYTEETTGHLLRLLNKKGIPTSYTQMLITGECVLRQVERIPLEIRVWNYSAESLATRIGLPEGRKLPKAVLEHYWQNQDVGFPLLNEYHIMALDLAISEEMELMAAYALRLNRLLDSCMIGSGYQLVGFSLSFGRLPDGTIALAEELSSGSCRFWDDTAEKMVEPGSHKHAEVYGHLCESLLKDLI